MAQGAVIPEKITRPIQLTAAWFVTLVLLVGAFLSAANVTNHPPWLPVVCVGAAVSIVPLFAFLVFLLQTKYRTELLADTEFLDWHRRVSNVFRGFRPEASQGPDSAEPAKSAAPLTDYSDLHAAREAIYKRNRNLFLSHTWRPSQTPGQKADITIRLHEHAGAHAEDGERPLTDGRVSRVEYYFGRYWFGGRPVEKTNPNESFKMDVSAYGSALCVAKVHFKDGTTPVTLDRYVDFVP
jgi:prokaryotic YEATS domain